MEHCVPRLSLEELGKEGKEISLHDELQGFFVHGELDGDVREVVVYLGIRLRLDGRIVHRVLMVLIHRAHAVEGWMRILDESREASTRTLMKDSQRVEDKRTKNTSYVDYIYKKTNMVVHTSETQKITGIVINNANRVVVPSRAYSWRSTDTPAVTKSK
jgi:hypothetical protein